MVTAHLLPIYMQQAIDVTEALLCSLFRSFKKLVQISLFCLAILGFYQRSPPIVKIAQHFAVR